MNVHQIAIPFRSTIQRYSIFPSNCSPSTSSSADGNRRTTKPRLLRLLQRAAMADEATPPSNPATNGSPHQKPITLPSSSPSSTVRLFSDAGEQIRRL
ncbi:hypothetical protein ACLOJK_018415 [Asimina triloba]